MRYLILYAAPARRDIAALPSAIRKRLRAKLEFYYAQPDPLKFAKRLSKAADAQYRFRIGDFRVLFDVGGNELKILRVQHRRDVYR